MLELDDPLWRKLDAAFRDQDIPGLLAELADTWDIEKANSLFWDVLCHQDTCYVATYAAVPHLLRIASPEQDRSQRLEIAIFVGRVALCAREATPSDALSNFPDALDDWERQLDPYRTLVAALEDRKRQSSDYERAMLPHYRDVLSIGPIGAADLEKVRSIRTVFLSALPDIGALCERALIENLSDNDAALYLLSGIAAANGLLSLSRLLSMGREGSLSCANCQCSYEYILFGERLAIYVQPPTPYLAHRETDRGLRDFEDGTPTRCDGFVISAEPDDLGDGRAQKLLDLTARTRNAETMTLLNAFLGRLPCVKCGETAALPR